MLGGKVLLWIGRSMPAPAPACWQLLEFIVFLLHFESWLRQPCNQPLGTLRRAVQKCCQPQNPSLEHTHLHAFAMAMDSHPFDGPQPFLFLPAVVHPWVYPGETHLTSYVIQIMMFRSHLEG